MIHAHARQRFDAGLEPVGQAGSVGFLRGLCGLPLDRSAEHAAACFSLRRHVRAAVDAVMHRALRDKTRAVCHLSANLRWIADCGRLSTIVPCCPSIWPALDLAACIEPACARSADISKEGDCRWVMSLGCSKFVRRNCGSATNVAASQNGR